MVITQIPVEAYHERIPDPTLADAMLDRLVNNAYRLQLSGESQRRLRSALPMSARESETCRPPIPEHVGHFLMANRNQWPTSIGILQKKVSGESQLKHLIRFVLYLRGRGKGYTESD